MKPVVHEVRCTYPQCQATNGCVGACSKTEPVHASDIPQERVDETPKCKDDPRAPHGFDRNASHSADRYVCECEGWEPPKEWVGLTDQEIYDIREDHTYNDEEFNDWGFAKDIEAKLKEKNVPQP